MSRETLKSFTLYANRLERWQKTHNLVSPGTLPELWSRHMADSAQLVGMVPQARRWLDLGSGAGFPGMVAAIMLAEAEDAEVHLVESNAKKCAFLNTVRRETGAPVTVHEARIERVANHLPKPFHVISARALAPLSELCAYVLPLMKKNTIALFPKGREAPREIDEALRTWNLVYNEVASLTDPQGRILMVQSLQRRERLIT